MKNSINRHRWIVIGGGPAGMTYLTQLLSHKVKPESILWIDKEFIGGAFHKFEDVPGNTHVSTFINWACSNSVMKSLSEDPSDPLNELRTLTPQKSCSLGTVHKVMLNYTNQLRKIVPSKEGTISKLEFDTSNNFWKAIVAQNSNLKQNTNIGNNGKSDHQILFPIDEEILTSTNVCIATGAIPLKHTNLHLGLQNKQEISLHNAFNLDYLKANLKPHDVIGIIGGSHSAFVIMYLINSLQIPNIKIVNFYKSEVRYAVYNKDFILYDNTGLKGEVAEWAKAILQKGEKPNFKFDRISVKAPEEQLSKEIQECTKFIYSHGFQRCSIPEIIYPLKDAVGYEGSGKIYPNISSFMNYSNFNGNINVPHNTQGEETIKGLYGFGLAFPQKVITRVGELEYNVGLAKFAKCADLWMKKTEL